MSNELSLTSALNGIEGSKAQQIESVFAPMVEMLKGFETEYNSVIKLEKTKENCQKAKTLRIAIGKIRISAEKERKSMKEQYLLAGRAIDGVNNILKFAVIEKENALKEMENHFENLEKERIQKIADSRLKELQKYGVEECSLDLGTMEEPIWENFLTGTKMKFEQAEREQLELERAQKEAEERRNRETSRRLALSPLSSFIDNFDSIILADLSNEAFEEMMQDAESRKANDDAERERTRIENEKLKKEADEKEEADRLEREKREKEEQDRLDKERKAREEAEAEANRLSEEKREREAEEKRQADLKAKEERKRLAAPDKEKLQFFAATIKNIDPPNLETEEAKAVLSKAISDIMEVAKNIEVEAVNL